MDDAVHLVSVDKVYGDEQGEKTQVLYDINLRFERGGISAIVGASGSGKSTLLNIIGTLDRPTSGSVLIDNKDTVAMGSNELAVLRNATIGFIFQFHYLLPEFTARENVLMPYRLSGKTLDDNVRKRADELMDLVGLSKVKDRIPSKMSGGQQQRTAIARALINDPVIVLADEPTGNLDSDTTETVYSLLREINKERGTTFLVITHDRRIAEKTDRIVEVKDGRITLDVRS